MARQSESVVRDLAMSRRAAIRQSASANRNARHAALLAGVSAMALLAVNPDAVARPLGGGTTPVDAAAAAIAATQTGSQEAARAGRDAQDALQRATRAIQAMQAGQQAARDAARLQPGGVPNGLAPGGLQIGAGVVRPDTTINPQLWQGARLPTEVAQADRVKVNIDQTQQKAILTWDTFNVGARTDLRFNQQGNRDWVALNQVLGADARPSQILGSITADGSVYVINQNGIVFGATSQVNVGSLIASTATISNDQFLTKGIYSTQAGGNSLPSFTDARGVVKVEAGAEIATLAPSSVTAGGGFVLMMGTSIENAGGISTPRGQTQLAAGDDFVLRRGYGTDTNQQSTTRGNEITPLFQTGSSSGTTINTGVILAQQGDITLAGRAVTQNGVLVSTTSVNTRGTIHLLDAATDGLGSVTLGGASFTSVLPELDSAESALDSQRDGLKAISGGGFGNLPSRGDQSLIEIASGGNVLFKSGSLTVAQGGQINVSAGRRIFAESGATLDVSGVRDVPLPMSANNILVNIQGNELRDSPVNRDQDFLKNANVWIDVRDLVLVPRGVGGYETDRYYTPGGLLEVGGYLGTRPHGIGEWAALGGTITLLAPEVVARQGSTFDISGGTISYAGGTIRTTNFLGRDGRIYNISDARGDQTFYGIGKGFVVEHARWGVAEIYTSPLGRGRETVRFEDGYTVGRDAGNLVLSTPTSIFQGTIVADVVTGERQTNKRPDGVTDGYNLTQTVAPLAGGLIFANRSEAISYGTDVRFDALGSQSPTLTPASAIDALRVNTAWFDSRQINAFNLGSVTVETAGTVKVADSISLANGGQFSLSASSIDIAASITARGGDIRMDTTRLGSSSGERAIVLHSGAELDVRGVWTNALINASALAGLAFRDGGSVTLQSAGRLELEQGASIDASSGAAILASGKTASGKGGDVSLASDYQSTNQGGLILDGNVRAFGASGGGKLAIQTSRAIVVGDSVNPASNEGDPLHIAPSLFRSGFGTYEVRSSSNLVVDDGTSIAVELPVYRFNAQSFKAASGVDPAAALEVWTPPAIIADPVNRVLNRRAGASLTLAASIPGASTNAPTTGGMLTLGRGASINVDAGQSVRLEARGQITIDGSITARGGNVTIVDTQLGAEKRQGSYDTGNQSIWLGATSRIDVSGQAWQARDTMDRAYGLVLGGGSVTIGSASGEPNIMGLAPTTQAFIIQRAGSVIDASGASVAVDVVRPGVNSLVETLSLVSDGGIIAFNSSTGIFLGGDVIARKGGAGASGGTLSIALETPVYLGVGLQTDPAVLPDAFNRLRVITVAQERGASPLKSDLTAGGSDPALVAGARIGVDQIVAGGFDGLVLRSRDLIRFENNISLRLGRSLELGGVIASAGGSPATVDLYAPYVFLSGAKPVGSPNGSVDYYPGLVWGPTPAGGWSSRYRGATTTDGGTLTLSAAQIDVRDNALFGISGRQGVRPGSGLLPNALVDEAGFADVNLNSSGDIRFMSSSLASGDNLTLTAAQIYPVTNSVVTIFAGYASGLGESDAIVAGHTLAIRRSSAADPALPYSVFGSLSLFADTIEQGGVIRAPLGLIEIGTTSSNAISPRPLASAVRLLPGSVTSISAAGLVMPFGGTVDGQRYSYGGVEYAITADGTLRRTDRPGTSPVRTLLLGGKTITVEDTALVDLSGGGDLLGAAFSTGRGGSIDVLQSPLSAAGPGYAISSATNSVYAIVPGYAGVAPIVPDAAGGTPRTGQQITLTESVPGLPAGTYTLLPATFATVPGAYRVEVGASDLGRRGVVTLEGGSYLAAARLGIANTGIVASAPSRVILTPSKVVETLSGYNRTGYAEFITSRAAIFGNVRGAIPADGGLLKLLFASAPADRPLTVLGDIRMAPAPGGRGGVAQVEANGGEVPIEIRPVGAAATDGFISLLDSDLNRLSANTLLLNGSFYTSDSGLLTIGGTAGSPSLTLRSGSVLSAAQVLVTAAGGSITMEGGAVIDTTGRGQAGLSAENGFPLGISYNAALLAVSNGLIDIRREDVANLIGTGSLILNDGAILRAEGSVGLSAPNQLSIGTIDLAARDLNLALNAINIGSPEAIAAAGANGVLPVGWTLTQQTIDQLLRPVEGRTRLERLTLTTRDSFNLFGSVELNTLDPVTGRSSVELALVTPAIYGLGAAGDVATIRTGRLIWNGRMVQTGSNPNTYGSAAPGAVLPAGPGTGQGRLALVADEIVFGFGPQERPQNEPDLQRLAFGFAAVDVTASQRITANNKGTLNVYRSGTDAASYAGGDLNLTTPLLTGVAGSMMTYKAGGAINVAAPAGAAAVNTAGITEIGGELRFNAGGALTLDTAVALPSGRLALNARGAIALGDRAAIDLSGRRLTFFDVDKYSWGGDLLMESADGAITQAAGSIIDVSALNNAAGTIRSSALGAIGAVTFAGRLRGQSNGGFDFGGFELRARTPGDFAGLNRMLNDAGFFGARDFQYKTGDLVVGDEVRASLVSITLDGGSLAVVGRIDASGAKPGAIRLAARDDLTLASSAVLDVHATQLHTDSYGAPIDASNRGRIDLTSTEGFVTLAANTTLDLRSADAVARGKVEINARRLGGVDGAGDGADDIAINAADPVTILGAASIAANGFRNYTPADGIINQGLLDTIHIASTAFIDATRANGAAMTRLSGLSAYGNAFHLRPGVEIRSDGDLTVEGDLDLSGYRYGPNANPAVRGSGEAGVISLRAGGNLTVKGSITDGFGRPAATPDDNGWTVNLPSGNLTQDFTVPASVTLGAFSSFTTQGSLNFDFRIAEYTEVKSGSVIPVEAAIVYLYLPAGTALTAPIYDSQGVLLYAAGTVLTDNVELFNYEVLGAGFAVSQASYVALASMVWRAGTSLSIFSSVQLAENTRVDAGAILPAGSNINYVGPASISSRPVGPDGVQGRIWAVAPMLAPGSQSWSMRLASGSDLGSASSRSLASPSTLGGGGNLTLDDLHYSGPSLSNEAISVIRTGAADLELLAGGSYVQKSLFGVYTAGRQTAGVDASHNLGRNLRADGTVLGAEFSDPATPSSYYAGAIGDYQAWYPEQGGDLSVTVQGNLQGYALNGSVQGNNQRSSDPANWLWRQGGSEIGQSTAWWINFGTYVSRAPNDFSSPQPTLVGFSGFGALGGGNVTLNIGGDAGVLTDLGSGQTRTGAIDAAIGGTGRIMADGSLRQTGGGTLTLNVGGTLNSGAAPKDSTSTYLDGVLANVRGDINVAARSIGRIVVNYGAVQPNDPRPVGDEPATADGRGGIYLALGDSAASLRTRGDLVLGTVLDLGRQRGNVTLASVPGDPATLANAESWFTLWTSRSAVNLVSAGGDLTANTIGTLGLPLDDRADYYPGTLRAVAAGGNIYGRSATFGRPLELAPFSNASFELLARGSIYGNGGNSADGPLTFAISGADPRSIATPTRPGWLLYQQDAFGPYDFEQLGNNAWDGAGPIGELFRFGVDKATGSLHAANSEPARVYALTGDIEDFRFGYAFLTAAAAGTPASIDYASGKPLSLRAGRDIVALGSPVVFGAFNQLPQYQSTLIVHANATDVSTIQAGRDIFYANVTIAGPGTLDVSAGRNLYQGGRGTLHSIGPLSQQLSTLGRDGGAGISVAAGVGANGPAYAAFARLYLDPANLADAARPLADQPGKVAKTYADELAAWLADRYGWSPSLGGALAYFQALAPEQQGVFLRKVYFEELRQGGREYTDVGGRRFGSYLRGREAIAALFPDRDAAGNPVSYAGDVTMFGERRLQFYDGGGYIPVYRNDLPVRDLDAAIYTDFGGDVQVLTPGGGLTVGVDGIRPVQTSGLLTQGSGDIQVFSRDSVLLGLSRVFTTFGGDITIWSAQGDINAGRGAKTTSVFAPARRVYDDYGQVTLSPTVPTSGAGIGTLNPIPEVPAGDIDLIAPLGTIDAGEAGIRISGNINLAALQIVNAANIQAQGTSTGIPTVQAPNVAGLTQAANTAGAAAQQATSPTQANAQAQPSVIIVEVLGFGGGDAPNESDDERRRRSQGQQTYNATSPYQVLGVGALTDDQVSALAAEKRASLGRR